MSLCSSTPLKISPPLAPGVGGSSCAVGSCELSACADWSAGRAVAAIIPRSAVARKRRVTPRLTVAMTRLLLWFPGIGLRRVSCPPASIEKVDYKSIQPAIETCKVTEKWRRNFVINSVRVLMIGHIQRVDAQPNLAMGRPAQER